MMTIDRIDPRLKFTWFLVGLISAFIMPNILCQCVLILITIILELCLTKSLKSFGVLSIVLLILGIQLAIIQLLFCRTGVPLWHWGSFIVYSDALPNALRGFLRTSALAFIGVQFIGWTSAMDATLMLCAFHVPYRYAMLVGVTARFFPQMKREYQAITESQAVRGMPTVGIVNRIKALPPTFFPMLYRAMRRAGDAALSMDLRGLGQSQTHTFSRNLCLQTWEKVVIALLIIGCIALIGLRLASLIFALP